jgi:uncharacterized membrane protein
MAEFMAILLIGGTFWTVVFLLWMGGKAAGNAAKTAVTAHPQETLGLVKFVLGMLRK